MSLLTSASNIPWQFVAIEDDKNPVKPDILANAKGILMLFWCTFWVVVLSGKCILYIFESIPEIVILCICNCETSSWNKCTLTSCIPKNDFNVYNTCFTICSDILSENCLNALTNLKDITHNLMHMGINKWKGLPILNVIVLHYLLYVLLVIEPENKTKCLSCALCYIYVET